MVSDLTTTFGAAERAGLADGAYRIGATGMVPGSAGNLSVRHGDRMLITPRGAELATVAPDELVEVGIDDRTRSPEGARASSETPLHRAVYAATGAGAVVHTHAHYATVMSTLVDELPAVHYATTAFGGTVRVARYATFGTDELAASVSDALEGRCAALMANHGAIVAGRDIEHAVGLMIALEWLASVAYHAITVGTPRTLSTAELDAVVTQARTLNYGLQAAGR